LLSVLYAVAALAGAAVVVLGARLGLPSTAVTLAGAASVHGHPSRLASPGRRRTQTVGSKKAKLAIFSGVGAVARLSAHATRPASAPGLRAIEVGERAERNRLNVPSQETLRLDYAEAPPAASRLRTCAVVHGTTTCLIFENQS
jgi:hypothetical protein